MKRTQRGRTGRSTQKSRREIDDAHRDIATLGRSASFDHSFPSPPPPFLAAFFRRRVCHLSITSRGNSDPTKTRGLARRGRTTKSRRSKAAPGAHRVSALGSGGGDHQRRQRLLQRRRQGRRSRRGGGHHGDRERRGNGSGPVQGTERRSRAASARLESSARMAPRWPEPIGAHLLELGVNHVG